jgi:hypothetical protein
VRKQIFTACLGLGLAAALAVYGLVSPGRALAGDQGDGGADRQVIIDVYHDYYIPFVPGADNCYGTYRFLGQRGVENYQSSSGTRQGQVAMNGDIVPYSQNMTDFTDMKDLYRDDVLIFTDFAVVTSREDIEYKGNVEYHHHRKFYYETPCAVLGYVTAMNPLYGVSDYEAFAEVTLDRETIKRYMPDFRTDMLCPASRVFGNKPDDPKAGKILQKKAVSGSGSSFGPGSRPGFNSLSGQHYRYILSLLPQATPERSGWWMIFSRAVQDYIDMVRANPELYVDRRTPEDLAFAAEVSSAVKEQEAHGLKSSVFDVMTEWLPSKKLDPIFLNYYTFNAGSSVLAHSKSDGTGGIRYAATAGRTWKTGDWRIFLRAGAMRDKWIEASRPILDRQLSAYDNATIGRVGNQTNQGQEGERSILGAETGSTALRVKAPWGMTPLDAYPTPTQGLWSAEPLNAEGLDAHRVVVDGKVQKIGYVDSAQILLTDAEKLANWPFAYAQYCFWQARARQAVGTSKSLSGAAPNLTQIIGGSQGLASTTAIGQYLSHPSGTSFWADPFLPGDGTWSSKWYYWMQISQTDRDLQRKLVTQGKLKEASRPLTFYETLVPYMSLRMSLTLLPETNQKGNALGDAVAWKAGYERRFWPLKYYRIADHLVNDSSRERKPVELNSSRTAEVFGRVDRGKENMPGISDEERGGWKVIKQGIDWVKGIWREEGDATERTPAFQGETTTKSTYDLDQVQYAGVESLVKYYPTVAEATQNWVAGYWPFVIQNGKTPATDRDKYIVLPSLATHQTVWSTFGRFTAGAASAGLSANILSEWPAKLGAAR